MSDGYNDASLRITALDYAVQITLAAIKDSGQCEMTDDDTVTIAETFYAFLTASSDTSDQARSGAETQIPRPE